MTVTITPVGDDIYTAVRSFLLMLLPTGVEVIAGLDNGVPMPSGDFVAITFGSMERLSTNIDTYASATVASVTPWQTTIDIDIYSPSGQQYAALVAGVLRSEYAADNFPAPVAPLYCSDPMQLPFITAEENWLQRWRLSFFAQITATLTLPAQSAIALAIGIEPPIDLDWWHSDGGPVFVDGNGNVLVSSSGVVFEAP